MRVAALYDVHGNLPALEATLRDVHAASVDAVVVGGDVLPGALPRETLACVTALDVPVYFIHGNGDRVVAAYVAGGDISEVPEGFRECFTRTTPTERLEPVFAGVDASVVVCGHTHMQFDRTLARHRVVNAGSVGTPFSAPRGAYWLLLANGLHLRRTDYDVDAAADSGVPALGRLGATDEDCCFDRLDGGTNGSNSELPVRAGRSRSRGIDALLQGGPRL